MFISSNGWFVPLWGYLVPVWQRESNTPHGSAWGASEMECDARVACSNPSVRASPARVTQADRLLSVKWSDCQMNLAQLAVKFLNCWWILRESGVIFAFEWRKWKPDKVIHTSRQVGKYVIEVIFSNFPLCNYAWGPEMRWIKTF